VRGGKGNFPLPPPPRIIIPPLQVAFTPLPKGGGRVRGRGGNTPTPYPKGEATWRGGG